LTQQRALDSYQEASAINARAVSRTSQLASEYQNDYISGLLPAGRVAAIGRPPKAPAPPQNGDAAEWLLWYQRSSAWASEQQVWNARLYRYLLDEVSAGGLNAEAVNSYGQSFVRARLPEYLAELAEAVVDAFCDMLTVANDSVDRLADAVLGTDGAAELTVDLRGSPGAILSTALVVDNNRGQDATVQCVAAPTDGFRIGVEPSQVDVAAGGSQKIVIDVTLPDEPTDGPVQAGIVTVTGHDDVGVAVLLQVAVDRPATDAITVRPVDDDA
jgi:hypothetical protein